MLASSYLLAADFRVIGLTVGALVLIAFVALFFRNIQAAKPELGSEIELAPNRKPYLSDEELEGTKLDKALTFALVNLGILALALPLYWLAEPGRQSGAIDAYNASFESRGEGTYVGGAQCVNCHAAGGTGGVAPYVLQDGDGQFVANAQWQAPALNNVLLRYSEEEVRFVLNFGRPGSPMAAWGTPGGGPLTTQQVDNVIIYLRTVQVQSLDPVDIALAGGDDPNDAGSVAAQEAADELSAAVRAEVDRSIAENEFSSIGEAVFNMGLYSGFQGASLSCARCHTAGWSLGIDATPNALDPGVAGCGGGNPSGIGFNLCGGSVKDRFPDDTWKRADGSWLPAGGLDDDQGFYIEASDGSKVRLDGNGSPVDGNGAPYLVFTGVSTVDGDVATPAPDLDGDLAACAYVSQLWQPDSGLAYPFAADAELEVDEESGDFVAPDELTGADVPGDVYQLSDRRLVGDCTVVAMPERTSQAHYNFIYNGAEAGAGYGQGGLSAAGMMPAFGALLPPDYIQAVVDYERGL
ncbi:MAG: c-type cytochrome [Acidimicrobiales bacterium]